MEILRVENLSKVYGKGTTQVTAIDNLSFQVEKGEFVAIVGASRKWKINTFAFTSEALTGQAVVKFSSMEKIFISLTTMNLLFFEEGKLDSFISFII